MEYLLSFFILAFIFPEDDFKQFTLSIPNSKESINFVPVKGGVFNMGNDGETSEKPSHKAEVSDFWISTHEVTWKQYELFVRRIKEKEQLATQDKLSALGIAGISSATQPYTDMSFGMGKDKYPVVNITQYAALSYCKWLSALTGEFYRLPTEAEWEYAAKGGTYQDIDKVMNSLDEYAWFKENSSSTYQQVGQKKPNSLGLYDILGNAAEWTMDGYAPYEESPSKDFWRIPDSLYPRVARGGSWVDEKSKITATRRIASRPEWKIRDPQLPKSRWWHTNAPFVGFRVVKPRNTPSREEITKYWLKVFEDYN